MRLPTYLINLKARTDRKNHSINEFCDRREFDFHIVEAYEHTIGAIGLLKTIKSIIEIAIRNGDDCILICQDDHIFTEHYSKDHFFNCIKEAQSKDACILAGGVSWYQDAMPISDHLFWTSKFTGAQFLVIYDTFFQKILGISDSNINACDLKLSSLTDKIFFIYPFISIQKEFGYSDITEANTGKGMVDGLFLSCSKNLKILKEVSRFYEKHKEFLVDYDAFNIVDYDAFNNSRISTYIINHQKKNRDSGEIGKGFLNKKEFEVFTLDSTEDMNNTFSSLPNLQAAVKVAIKNDDDVIVIAKEDTEFSMSYSKSILIKNILKANSLGVDYLGSGTTCFDFAFPLSENLYWANQFKMPALIIIYRQFFETVLNIKTDNSVDANFLLSSATRNKMFMFPSIITLKEEEEESTNLNIRPDLPFTEVLTGFEERIYEIKNAYKKYLVDK
jgi:hypothetical protein